MLTPLLCVACLLAAPEGGGSGEGLARDSGHQTRAEAIAASWRWFFQAPGAHQWAAGAGGGLTWAVGADQRFFSATDLRLDMRRNLTPWLGAGASVEYLFHSDGTQTLTVRDSQTTLALCGGLLRWQGRYRFEAMAEVGGQLRTVELDDSSGTVWKQMALAPSVGLVGGAGVSVLGRVVAMLRTGVGLQAGRVGFRILFGLEWIIDPADQPESVD